MIYNFILFLFFTLKGSYALHGLLGLCYAYFIFSSRVLHRHLAN